MSVIIYDERQYFWPLVDQIATFKGDQIVLVAGTETIKVVDHDDLAAKAAIKGSIFKVGLARIATCYPFIGDIRGRG